MRGKARLRDRSQAETQEQLLSPYFSWEPFQTRATQGLG